MVKNTDYAQASKLLDELEPLLRDKKPGAIPVPPPPPPGAKGQPGTKPPPAPPPPGTQVPEKATQQIVAAVKGWQTASDIVDGQISSLQQKLIATKDKELIEIANFGMNAMTGNFKVKLMASMRELQSAQGPALRKAATKALPLATGLREHLDGDPRVIACDKDAKKFGVTTTINKTLGEALAKLETALEGVIDS
jgi:hypothetical protein